jgi:hypothetical protein
VVRSGGVYIVVMYKVLGIRRISDTDPQKYELRLHDSENKKPGYVMDTEYGTEEQVRAMLQNGGLNDATMDLYFANAG